jgi:general secretion pathway protein E
MESVMEPHIEQEQTERIVPQSYAQALKYGAVRVGAELVYCVDSALENVLDLHHLNGECQQFTALERPAFEERLEHIFHQSSGESQQIAQDLDQDIDLAALTEELPDNADLLSEENSAPVIRLINAILHEAVKEGASDIHIETFEKSLVIRFRVDGVLRPVLQPGKKLAPLLLSRIKVMARLDIAEKRLPQDGRISLRLGRRNIDVRVSTLPSQYGERAVLRLLDKSSLRLSIDKMGLSKTEAMRLNFLIQQPHGIILVTGPTGSGKSTTLYALLSELNAPQRNILTVEDPIEYELEGIGQTQVNSRVDMSFARGLRAILRQDPDIVMVGEIRDNETAQIAVQASLTGHLVLSTLHTNSASGAVTRLRDMGVEPFLLSSSLSGVIAQRLVRKLCTECRTQVEVPVDQQSLLSRLAPDVKTIWQANGCPQCRGSGYLGRLAIHEIMVVDSALRTIIHRDADEHAIEECLRKTSSSLQENGFIKAVAGETTLEEVMRVTAAQHDPEVTAS